MLLPIQALLARLSSATGIDFTLISPDTIELPADDAFKLAALVDLAQNPEAHVQRTLEMLLREDSDLDTVMGQPRERVAKDLADLRSAYEQEKLAEAGRKSWVTRRANATKKGGRK
jgi:hypothetical protein